MEINIPHAPSWEIRNRCVCWDRECGTERHDTATDLKSQKVPYSERQSQHFTSFIWRNRQFSMNERRIHVNSMNRSKLIWTNKFTVTSTSASVLTSESVLHWVSVRRKIQFKLKYQTFPIQNRTLPSLHLSCVAVSWKFLVLVKYN